MSDGATAPGWTSTRTVPEIAATLRKAKNVAVLTHARPDGDAVGSSLALARALIRTGTAALAWYIPPMPRWVTTFAGATPIRSYNAGAGVTLAASTDPEPDNVVVVDTGAWVQLDEAAPWVKARTAKTLVIDHHLGGDADMSAARLLVTKAAAAAEIVADVCIALLDCGQPSKLPLEIAEPLYLGLATDTGWFCHSNTRPETLRLASGLLEAGVDAPKIYQMVEQQDRIARLRLQGRALSSMELFKNDSIALMTLTAKDFEECHGDSDDTNGFASDVLSVTSIQVGIMLTEVAGREGKGPIAKASLRSKPGPGAIDVAALTRSLGGGGHARAAGVKLAMSLADAKKALLEKLTS